MESEQTVSFRELMHREVISLQSGSKIGFADDLILDVQNARIVSLVIYGSHRWFSDREDLYIPWEELKLIGEDTVLVGDVSRKKQPAVRGIKSLFGRLTAFFRRMDQP